MLTWYSGQLDAWQHGTVECIIGITVPGVKTLEPLRLHDTCAMRRGISISSSRASCFANKQINTSPR